MGVKVYTIYITNANEVLIVERLTMGPGGPFSPRRPGAPCSPLQK